MKVKRYRTEAKLIKISVPINPPTLEKIKVTANIDGYILEVDKVKIKVGLISPNYKGVWIDSDLPINKVTEETV